METELARIAVALESVAKTLMFFLFFVAFVSTVYAFRGPK